MKKTWIAFLMLQMGFITSGTCSNFSATCVPNYYYCPDTAECIPDGNTCGTAHVESTGSLLSLIKAGNTFACDQTLELVRMGSEFDKHPYWNCQSTSAVPYPAPQPVGINVVSFDQRGTLYIFGQDSFISCDDTSSVPSLIGKNSEGLDLYKCSDINEPHHHHHH